MRKMSLFFFSFSLVLFTSLTSVQALEVHQLTTPKGIQVWFSPDKTVPVISMAYSFEKAGSAHEPQDKEGLAGMTAALLTEGAGKRDANALSEKLAELAVGIGFGADADYFRGSFKTTLRTKKEAIALLKDVLYKPHLSQDRLDLLRQKAIAGLKASLKQPNYILGKTARETLYAGHPYARPADGTLTSLQGITREDIQGFLKKNLERSNLRVAICGNLSKDDVIAMVDSIFAGLPQKVEVTPLPVLEISFSGKTVTIPQDIPQSVCLFYHPGLNVDHENYMMLALVTDILGGGFVSRLAQEVREKKGLAYTVNSFLSLKKKVASLGGFVGTENPKVHEALAIIHKEYAKLASFGITEKELKEAKQAAVGSFILRLSSTAVIASQLLTYQEIKYPASYVNERASKINAIQLNEVNAFVNAFFAPEKVTAFIVGNPSEEGKNDKANP